MRYVFQQPVKMGDLQNQISIDSLELASVSFNFEPFHKDAGKAIVSVVLVHRSSGYKANIVIPDAAGLALWNQVRVSNFAIKGLDIIILEYLLTNLLLPAGSVAS